MECGKGIRMVKFIEKGKVFVIIVYKWKLLWCEIEIIVKLDSILNLNVVVIGSLIIYVFLKVF